MKPSLRRGNVKWFSTRSKPGAKRRAHRSPMQLIALRMRDLANLYRSRYGIALPDGDALVNPQRWKADALAWRLRLTAADRAALGITTIGAIDENKAARTKRRRAKDRQRKENARRAKGVKPRATYEGQSTSKAKPWLEEGISRAQWYRRRARETDPSNETGAATP
jgi:hypothetical protein